MCDSVTDYSCESVYFIAGETGPGLPGSKHILIFLPDMLDLLSSLQVTTPPADNILFTDFCAVDIAPTNTATANTTTQSLELPQALLRRSSQTTRRTRLLIQAIVGQDNSKEYVQSANELSSWQMRIHIPQHFSHFLPVWRVQLLPRSMLSLCSWQCIFYFIRTVYFFVNGYLPVRREMYYCFIFIDVGTFTNIEQSLFSATNNKTYQSKFTWRIKCNQKITINNTSE